MAERGRVETTPTQRAASPLPTGSKATGEAGGDGSERVEEAAGHPGAHGRRHLGREMALQMLYQFDLAGSSPEEIFHSFDLTDFRTETSATRVGSASVEKQLEKEREAFLYAKRLVGGTLENLSKIDDWVREQAENWRIERMSTVDRNVLRLAVYELAFEEDVPKVVVLDEAIELAKKFGSEQSGAFVNGLLDALLRERRFPGRLT